MGRNAVELVGDFQGNEGVCGRCTKRLTDEKADGVTLWKAEPQNLNRKKLRRVRHSGVVFGCERSQS